MKKLQKVKEIEAKTKTGEIIYRGNSWAGLKEAEVKTGLKADRVKFFHA